MRKHTLSARGAVCQIARNDSLYAGDITALDNPINTLGEVAKDGGDWLSKGLFGFARMLEQVTGDATSAAIFAAFLLFTISLIRWGAGSKNFLLYAGSLVAVGGGGMVVLAVIAILGAAPDFLSLWQENDDRDYLYQGLSSYAFSEEWKLRFIIRAIPGLLMPYKWHAFVLLNVLGVGLVMFCIAFLQEHFRSIKEE